MADRRSPHRSVATVIDLTPLDVRKKPGDFRHLLRGYDPSEVDAFLALAAERLESLEKENGGLAELAAALNGKIEAHQRRANAIQESVISAQTLREEVSREAYEEAETVLQEAGQRAAQVVREAREEGQRHRARVREEVERIHQSAFGDTERRRRQVEAEVKELAEEIARLTASEAVVVVDLQSNRGRFLADLRTLLEQELRALRTEEESPPDDSLERALSASRRRLQGTVGESTAADPGGDDVVAKEPASGTDEERGRVGPADQGMQGTGPSAHENRDAEETPGQMTVNPGSNRRYRVQTQPRRSRPEGDPGGPTTPEVPMGEVVMIPIDFLASMDDGVLEGDAVDSLVRLRDGHRNGTGEDAEEGDKEHPTPGS